MEKPQFKNYSMNTTYTALLELQGEISTRKKQRKLVKCIDPKPRINDFLYQPVRL